MKKELYYLLAEKREEIEYLTVLGVVNTSLSRNLDIYSLYIKYRGRGYNKEDCYLLISENFRPNLSLATVKKIVLSLKKQVKPPED